MKATQTKFTYSGMRNCPSQVSVENGRKEGKMEKNVKKALKALREIQSKHVATIRDKKRIPNLPAKELVSGDVVELRVDDKVPTDMQRYFSTESETGLPSQDSSPIDPFLQPPNTGLVYGRLLGANKHTLRTDIIHIFEGCNLTLDDIKFVYNRIFNPVALLVQFPSLSAYDAGIRLIARKGRLFRLEKADRSEWDITKPYNGKYLFLQGLPRNIPIDDVERFLSGFDFDLSSLEMFMRQGVPDKMATVRFPSQVEAMNAAITKNRGFCQNNQITVRVLQ
ncbi:hypothetical protein Nepgr_030504 [Nepenthes gracilis]|uniref:RRM domain-containing protein n=1 Tax=Nepenthes gracilis TaxID=150966 RepID=A0AAD3TGB7_NEPGR|nr:hypothetical protein Nepgr_030504 [Nepenthes gracilis]